MAPPDAPTPAAVVAAMFARDRASRELGMEVLAVSPGCARVAMTVAASMVNGHGHCHGGLVFCLADSAFAFACNNRNELAVASDCTINFLAPARLGDRLIADAVEVALAGRSGVYDVAVTNQQGAPVAFFRGRSRRLGGPVAAPETPA